MKEPRLEWREGPGVLVGAFKQHPETTMFYIERNPRKPDTGTLKGAFIPDAEDGRGANKNAEVSLLMYRAELYVSDWIENFAQMAPITEREIPEKCRLVAHDTGDGWHLSVTGPEGTAAILDWPETWPAAVNAEFLNRAGFAIE